MTGEDLKETITKCGIRVTEAAEIMVVSRHALYDWFNGTKPKNKLIYNNMVRMIKLMNKAFELGKFPLPPGRNSVDRLVLIRNILKEVYRA